MKVKLNYSQVKEALEAGYVSPLNSTIKTSTPCFMAAGTVDCCYPRPVKANNINDLVDFINNELPKHADKFRLSMEVKTHNAFSPEGEYVPASFRGGDLKKDDYNDCRGTMNETILNFKYAQKFQYRATKKYLNDDLIYTQSDSIDGLVRSIEEKGFQGTLDIIFKHYPDGANCYPENLACFKLLLGF